MLRRGFFLCAPAAGGGGPRTLNYMFRKLKLAGAHPDVLWSVDAQKAQHNGEEMIRLETLMHQREAGRLMQQEPRAGNVPQHFIFWFRQNGPHAGGGGPAMLRAAQCTITPLSHTSIVKKQLAELFQQAGVMEPFSLDSERFDGAAANVETLLRDADQKQNEHITQSSSLYVRGDKAIENLRRAGVLLAVEEDGLSYLVTLPETQTLQPTAATFLTPKGGAVSNGSGGAAQAYQPHRNSIIGPNGEVDPEVRTFLDERGMRPFDLRMAGSHSGVERFVQAFERLERIYATHRGRAVRPSVCLVISLRAPGNYVAPDGSLVLSVQRIAEWEGFLLGLPQAVWQDCVQQHLDWRVGAAPKLYERRRQLQRLADTLHVFRVVLDSPVGGATAWQERFVAQMLKDETAIRRAVNKYQLRSDLLKKRGEIQVREHLYSTLFHTPGDASGATRKEIGFRVCGDGKLLLNAAQLSTGQILRVLKDNLRRLETFQREHDRAVAQLEHMSQRTIPVDFSIDAEWKLREEGNLVHCLDQFAKTMKANEQELGAFLNGLLCHNQQPQPNQPRMPKKRMVWIVSDRFDIMPSGVVYIPYDVDFASIKKMLLSR
ncbi:hypothetical protein STCU_06957 [Strigomonas culicis]|uniref:Uncharacterized protein n=1 Tax=Strigomonas culicis TaxID=28005 RepID=S9U265_9TRYP|nr:hypothetical protein STCU_06957 [Strigomonas culicis]|eukprot:EPY24882.1 hypothetical protein STCU_06957 [Strigomonas culicis]